VRDGAVSPFELAQRRRPDRALARLVDLEEPGRPSIMTSRAAAKVSPTSAMRPTGSCVSQPKPEARPITHSAPARVLPAPRPPRTSQVVQSSHARSGGS